MNAVKVPREKDTYYIQRNKDKNKADFSLETMQLKRQLNNIFDVLKEKHNAELYIQQNSF